MYIKKLYNCIWCESLVSLYWTLFTYFAILEGNVYFVLINNFGFINMSGTDNKLRI